MKCLFLCSLISLSLLAMDKPTKRLAGQAELEKSAKRHSARVASKQFKDLLLHYAQDPMASLSYLEQIRELIKRGADVNAQDSEGRTFLMRAVTNQDLALVKELVEADADLTVQDVKGNTALMLAATIKWVKGIKFLLDAGAPLNTKDKAGFTALMISVLQDSEQTALVLLNAGADIDATDDDGETALMHAISPEMVLFLLKEGANPSMRNKAGKTAAEIAWGYQEAGTVKVIRDFQTLKRVK